MSKVELELASMVLGPFDEEHRYELYEGYVLNERHIFIMDAGDLWLRQVHKAPHMEHLYIDGDSGGLIIANEVEGMDTRALIETIITELKQMNGLQFLLDIMLWTKERGDINLKLEILR
ncbi:MAG TPA: hypothetical protein DEF35_04370 [Paenibacillus sp.]|uniref:hypothetical protein n=1 Tax=Paenibacillus TaxID=44249 RepID=UPI000BA13A9B|nr:MULTISPECIES: hypothetical protein [Paenibacillus]OZQ60786.1 hypothetical protein CA599_29525 [Paenibacillus taichungensis]HBU80862.1 hypothetical protein [Paenibacillus sp.]